MKKHLNKNQLVRVLTGDNDYITVIDSITPRGYIVKLNEKVYEVFPHQVFPVVIK